MPIPKRVSRLTAACALLLAIAALVAAGPAAAGQLSSSQAVYLAAAESGAGTARALWWDPRTSWYRQRLHSPSGATLWGSEPLFEALSGIAAADPNPFNEAQLAAFAAGAERYWNPNLDPAGGYSPSRGDRRATDPAWFDDNGWWGIAFLDAYSATGNSRYVADAKRAFAFIATAGWDHIGGGIWWSTQHPYKAGESIAAATLLAAMLYTDTSDPYYLAEAQKFVLWADESFTDPNGLYEARTGSDIEMPYVQGPMIAAQAMLCQASGDRLYCARAEQLAGRAVNRFGSPDMGPQYDAIYLRSLLALYRIDGDPRWYQAVVTAVDAGAANSRDASGVFSKAWDGGPITDHGLAPDLLQTHAATVSVFAWLAATPSP